MRLVLPNNDPGEVLPSPAAFEVDLPFVKWYWQDNHPAVVCPHCHIQIGCDATQGVLCCWVCLRKFNLIMERNYAGIVPEGDS